MLRQSWLTHLQTLIWHQPFYSPKAEEHRGRGHFQFREPVQPLKAMNEVPDGEWGWGRDALSLENVEIVLKKIIILQQKMWWDFLFRRIKKHNGGSLESAAAVQHQQEDHCGARQPHYLRRVQLAEDGDFAVQDVFFYELDFFFRLRPTMSFGELEKMGLLRITTRWNVFSISCEILPCSTLCMSDRWISP